MFELKPNDSHKSFYGKAYVCNDVQDSHMVRTLYSYGTRVLQYDCNTGDVRRLWPYWSATTQRHVNAFMALYHDDNPDCFNIFSGKRWFTSLPVNAWVKPESV